jgi:hypothetical protein
MLKYNNSPPALLTTLFPEYEWLPWKFAHTVSNFWDNVNNQRKFMDWATSHMKMKDLSDWYNITQREYSQFGGLTLLVKKYSSSPLRLLSTVYPEYNWLPWKFKKCPVGYWENRENVKKFMDWAGEQLVVTDFSDWYKVLSAVFLIWKTF